MDIKNLNTNIASGRSPESLKGQEKTESTLNKSSTENEAPSDKVTLTSMMSQVQELEKKAESVNIDNQSRIEALKASIQDGSYQVDSQKVAEKLLQTETLFAGL